MSETTKTAADDRRFVVIEPTPGQFAIQVQAEGGMAVQIAPKMPNEAAAWRLAEVLEREADAVLLAPSAHADANDEEGLANELAENAN